MIGVFDSGSGGLTVLSEIRKINPTADVIYLGDIKNAPYGTKTREELGALTVMLVNRLIDEGATKIVSACNSVSASIVLPMLSILSVRPFDIVEMVGPTVNALRNENRKILVAATSATIESGIYQLGFRAVGKEVEVIPIKELAGAIEFGASELEIEKIIKPHLAGVSNSLLVLGCTHYPLVKSTFEKILNGRETDLYDPALAVANEVLKWKKEKGSGRTRFLVTKDSPYFRKRVDEMFGVGNNIEVI